MKLSSTPTVAAAMNIKNSLANNSLSRLFLRIYSRFDAIPGKVAFENYRFYILTNIGYTLGWLLHAIWFFVFLYLHVYVMMLVQVACVACHIIAIIANRQGWHSQALNIGMTEVILHQVFAVYMLGWGAGFQYITIAVTLFPFLKPDGNWIVKVLQAAACLVSYLFIQIALSGHEPVFPLSGEATTVFNYSNITICFLLMATWGFSLTATIQLTEELLVEKTRDLVATEKALEQAQLVKQLELKERDAEIYRLRNVELKESNDQIQAQKKRSEELLLNILPEQTANELLISGKARPRRYEQATIMFTDFVNFTSAAEQVSAEELVAHIDRYFRAFDEIATRHEVEKIKTIGDAYMCAGGLPAANNTHALDVLKAALEILAYMEADPEQFFRIRIGIHTGPVVAGVVGHHKFQYDIWGDAVNIAARMEQHSTPGRINISGNTYELVKDYFECEHRGKVAAKNKGELEMYFVTGLRQ